MMRMRIGVPFSRMRIRMGRRITVVTGITLMKSLAIGWRRKWLLNTIGSAKQQNMENLVIFMFEASVEPLDCIICLFAQSTPNLTVSVLANQSWCQKPLESCFSSLVGPLCHISHFIGGSPGRYIAIATATENFIITLGTCPQNILDLYIKFEYQQHQFLAMLDSWHFPHLIKSFTYDKSSQGSWSSFYCRLVNIQTDSWTS